MVEVDDVIYVVTYQAGPPEVNTFGKVDKITGQFTQIKATAPDAISMTWNPVDGNVYYTVWGSNTSSQFGSIDVTTGNHTPKGTVPGLFYIAIDNDGICYGVGTAGVFGTVSLTNGAFSQISTYGDLNFIQDMAVDFETNELYHFRRWGTVASPGTPSFRKINKSTGAVTELGQFYSNRSVESFFIIGGNTPPSCDPVTNLAISYTTDCNAELSWTASANAVSYDIYRNNLKITTVAGTSYTDTDFEPTEAHTWKVVVVCQEDESAPISTNKDACREICNPPTNLTVDFATDCSTATLTWEAPAKSASVINDAAGNHIQRDKIDIKPVPTRTEIRNNYLYQRAGNTALTPFASKGNTAYGVFFLEEYYKFDVSDIMGASFITEMPEAGAGAYFDGKYYVYAYDRKLYVFDYATGDRISTHPYPQPYYVTGLAYDYSSNTMYGMGWHIDTEVDVFFTVDLTNGHLTDIKNITGLQESGQ